MPSVQPCPIGEIPGDEDALKNQSTFECSQNYIKPIVGGTSQVGFPKNNRSNISLLHCIEIAAPVTTASSIFQPRTAVSSMAFDTDDYLRNLYQINSTCIADGHGQRLAEEEMTSSSSHQPEFNVIKSFSKDKAPMNVSGNESIGLRKKLEGQNVLMKNNTTTRISTVGSYERPPFTYAVLAAMAIQDSPTYCCTFSDIFRFLQRRFPIFRGSHIGWKKLMRKTIMRNKCFMKLSDKSGTKQKRCYWSIDQSSWQFQKMQASGVLRKNETTGTMSSSLRQGNQLSLVDTSCQRERGQFCNSLVSTIPTAVRPTALWRTFIPSPPSMVNHKNASLPINISYLDGDSTVLTSASSLKQNNLGVMNNRLSTLGQTSTMTSFHTMNNLLDHSVDNSWFSSRLSDTTSFSLSQNTVSGCRQLQLQQLPVLYSYDSGSYSQCTTTSRCLGSTLEQSVSSGKAN